MKSVYLYEQNNKIPFEIFLESVDAKIRNKIEECLIYVTKFPKGMCEPHVKHFTLERYKALYELRVRLKIMVRIIFSLDKDENIVILHPFVKRHDRNTMQALECSLKMINEIENGTATVKKFQLENHLGKR